MESQLMLLIKDTTFSFPYACFVFFFYNFSQIWNMLIINIPHNLETTQKVEMQVVS